jgi:hypothetical protein
MAADEEGTLARLKAHPHDAQLESIADRGGICVSRQVMDQIEDKLELTFRELRRRNLKNIPKPIRSTPLISTSVARPHHPSLPPQISSKRSGIARRPMMLGWLTPKSAQDRR